MTNVINFDNGLSLKIRIYYGSYLNWNSITFIDPIRKSSSIKLNLCKHTNGYRDTCNAYPLI